VGWIPIAAGILGGVGLFLLGMRLMTEGLRIAAGRALRRVLERWTATRWRALLSGALITSLVQSSSAVTVAVIGFVNAGLLTLRQAVLVIYGSNVGTTATGWLVALVGFNMDLKALALPGIGVGMVLRLAGGARRAGALGEALAGFGLFFLGIDVLKSSLAGLQDGLPMAAVAVTGPGAALAFTLVGFALTFLMQSSSAAIALILTSVGGGAIPIEAGACLVIGANVGTTSTAAIAVLGATSNAKRVAVAHLAFNATTGAVGLLTLPLLLLLVGRFRQMLGLDAGPAAVLAAFHTLFNLLGVALMWPITDWLVAVLGRRFRTPEEDEARPRYLDRNVLSTPVLASGALGLELARIGAIARAMAEAALRREAGTVRLSARREALGQLLTATGAFVADLQRSSSPGELGAALPNALQVGRYYAEAASLAQRIAEADEAGEPLESELAWAMRDFEAAVLSALSLAAVDTEGTTPEAAARGLVDVQTRYQRLKDLFLRAGAEGRIAVGPLVSHLERASDVRRLAEQAEHGSQHLWELGSVVAGEPASEPGPDRRVDPARTTS